MDRVFKSRTGAEDTIMLEQARHDVGISSPPEDSAFKGLVKDDSSTTEQKISTNAHVEKA